MKAIILAGGFATRLWPLTEHRAKPLLLLENIPLISHIVAGIPGNIDVIVSTNKAFEQDFLDWKRKEFPTRNIEIFIEDSASEKEKVGALGAIALVIQQKQINEPLLVLAGDNYCGFSMQSFIDHFEGNPILAVFDIKDLNRAKQFGVVVSKNGKTVDHFEEKPLNPSSTLVSTGAYIFPANTLDDIVAYAQEKNDDLGGIFEYLRKKNQTINIFSFDEPWFDVGSFQGYLESHKELQKDRVLLAPKIDLKNSELTGAISVSEGCVIEDSLLENVILFPNVTVKNCEIRNCIIDQNCIITGLDVSHKIVRENSVLSK